MHDKPIVSCKGIFVKSNSTSKLAIIRMESKFLCSRGKEKESRMVYWLLVDGSKRGTKNLASL